MTKKERDELRWANLGLELAESGLKYGLKVKDTKHPATCDTSLWNLRMARRVIESLAGKFDPKTRKWVRPKMRHHAAHGSSEVK